MRHHLLALQQRLARQQKAKLAPLVQVQDLPINIAASQAAKLAPAELDHIYTPKRQAYQAMRAGRGNAAHWRELVDAVNVGTELMAYQYAHDHAATFAAAHAALAALAERHSRTRSWTLRAPELQAIDLAVQVHRAQLMYCSRGELTKALDTVTARLQAALRGQHTPGAVVVQPGTTPTATKAAA